MPEVRHASIVYLVLFLTMSELDGNLDSAVGHRGVVGDERVAPGEGIMKNEAARVMWQREGEIEAVGCGRSNGGALKRLVSVPETLCRIKPNGHVLRTWKILTIAITAKWATLKRSQPAKSHLSARTSLQLFRRPCALCP